MNLDEVDHEIAETKKAIKKLEDSGDEGAAKLAKKDLETYEVLKKQIKSQ